MAQRKRILLLSVYVIATIQFVWCYLWLTRPYDSRLRAWLWLLPIWCLFMFVYGILIETRVFGELIPFVVCATTLIVEELLLERMSMPRQRPELQVNATSKHEFEVREAA